MQKGARGVDVTKGRPTIDGPHNRPSRIMPHLEQRHRVVWFAHGVDKCGCGIPTLLPAPDLILR